MTDTRLEVARLRTIIDMAVEELCYLAEEVQKTDGELADRIWSITNQRLEIPVRMEMPA